MVTKTKDRPLYIWVGEGKSSIWFVIEDKCQEQQQEDDDEIVFRQLDFPELGYQRFLASLVVLNSKLYLIGGTKINLNKTTCPVPVGEPVSEYEYLNLQERRLRWRRQPFRRFLYTQHLASCKDGLIYGLGPHSYVIDPALRFGVIHTDLPKIPGEHGHSPQPLAISKNKIYAYSRGGVYPNLQHYLFSYDMEEKTWECIFKNFWGDWATGVALSGDTYLIAYGSRHPIEWKKDRPGVWVFDIRRRQWLDEPVEGLDEALPVIPDWVYEEVGYVYVYYLPCLFQIGEHRFALIWEESDEESDDEIYKLHCHKFTLQAPTSTDQQFVAQQLSNKIITLNGGNNKILGCTVGCMGTEQGIKEE
ncbi:hypothetical protein ACLB2K_069783 [Fragaria x ananassa]